MSDPITLPLDATIPEIAQAIRTVQARARARLCTDPEALAARVRTGIDRAQHMAEAVGVRLADLYAGGTWWEGSDFDDGDVTRVRLAYRGIEVERGSKTSCSGSGVISLSLRDRP